MANKVAYDTDKRIIYVTTAPVDGVVDLDVQIDLYSDIKEDWQSDATLNRFVIPISSVGGNPLPGSKVLGDTYFLEYPWKIRPYEADHKLAITGNLFSIDGSAVTIPTIGNYNVLVEMFVSNLSDSSIIENPIDEQLDYSGVLHYDAANIEGVGQSHPIGTTASPVNNITDAFALTQKYYLHNITLHSNFILDRDIEAFNFHGLLPQIIVNANGFKMHQCKFEELILTGDFNNSLIRADQCGANQLLNIYGSVDNSYLLGKILIAAGQNLNLDNSQSGIVGLDSPEIDMQPGEDTTLSLRAFSGGMTITNCDTPNCVATLSFQDGGKPHLEPSNTDGLLSVRGLGALDDRSAGTTVEVGAWLDIVDIDAISYIEKWIYINTELVINGDGKEATPFNNISDAVDFAESRGWHKLMLLADATLERTLKNFSIEGIGLPTIDLNGQDVDKSEFSKVKLTGLQVGAITGREVVLMAGLSGVNGIYKDSGIAGDFSIADGAFITLASISTLFATTPAPIIIDMGVGGSGILNVRKLSGAINIKNVDTALKVATFEFSGGKLVIDNTCTDGIIGVAGLPDTAVFGQGGGSNIIKDGLLASYKSLKLAQFLALK